MAFVLAFVALVAMGVAVAFMQVKGAPCGKLPDWLFMNRQIAPVMALELAQTPADLEQIFGKPEAQCDSKGITGDLHHATLVDTFAYIPAYAAFYALVAYALRRDRKVLGWIAMSLAVGCAVADLCENRAIFLLMDTRSYLDWLPLLMVATNIKWIGLAVVTALCGLMLPKQDKLDWLRWLGVAICFAPLPVSLWALAAPKVVGEWLLWVTVFGAVPLGVTAIAGSLSQNQRTNT
jgi:hypothetical protein